jgi:type IV pilus assembly protein PilM
VADEQSIWKKEISFGRKRKEPAAEDAPANEQAQGDAPAEEPTSIWKKELSFGRKKKAADPEPVEETPEPVVAPEPVSEEPAWTRAVSFGRKAQPDSEPVSDEPVLEAVSEPVVDDVGPVAVPDPEPGPEETTVEEPAWTPAASFARNNEPVAVSAPPAPLPGVHAPVTAEELPPLEDAAKSVPFWKRDISFGGGKKKAPKAERAPKQKKEKKAKDTDGAQNVPFWKRDIGGSKDKKEKKEKEEKQPRERKAKQPKVKVERGSKGAKRIVGLKVGASQLAAARVANNGSAELLQVAREPLEAGIVVGGELRDPDALAEALKEFFTKHKLPKKGVRLGIANNRIGVRTFDIAGIDDQKQLTNAVRFRAQETLPIPIDEAVLDFQVLGEGVDEQGQPTKRILLVVAYRELIDRYVDACRKAGITLTGIDLEAFALLRALQAPQDGTGSDPSAALVAVAIGHDRSTFAVSDGRICEFTRVLEWGGSALNVAIARALDAAPSEVDGVKRALALTDEMVPEGLTPEQAQKARDSMRRAIQTFARELVSSLQYYQNQPDSLGIGEIVLTGGTAHLHGLASELEQLIGVRVRVGDPLARMKVSKKMGEADQIGSLAVAIGLGIED